MCTHTMLLKPKTISYIFKGFVPDSFILGQSYDKIVGRRKIPSH